ncbi:MAG: DUF2723 domain-containing protein [Candidatus Eisenbacteria bacterium]
MVGLDAQIGALKREPLPLRMGAWAVLLVLLFFLVITCRADLEGSDSAELVTTSYSLGIAHGTGYSLYTCIGHVALSISPLPPPRTMNLLSVLFGWAALVSLVLAAEQLAGRRFPATIPLAIVALARPHWFVTTVAEVYALHHLFVALTILFLFIWWRRGNFRFLALAAYFAALDLSHHGSTVFLVPIYVIFVLVHAGAGFGVRNVLLLLLLVFVGLSVQGYLPIRTHFGSEPVTMGNEGTNEVLGIVREHGGGSGTAEVLKRKLLGGGPMRKFAADRELITDNLRLAWAYLRNSMGFPLLIVTAAGIVWGVLSGPRLPILLLTGSALANLLAIACFRSYDWDDFLVPVILLLATVAAVFLGDLQGRFDRSRFGGILASALVLLLGIWSGSQVVHEARRVVGYRHGPPIVPRERALLGQELPVGSHVCVPWGRATVLRYLQVVEGIRPDVHVHPLGRAMYLAAADLWAGKEPLFVESASSEMQRRYLVEPVGSMLRVSLRDPSATREDDSSPVPGGGR